MTSRAPRVAVVHDWLTGMRGGEKVLEAICALYPDADLFTLVRVAGSVSKAIEAHPIRSSALTWVPGVRHLYRHFLPLFPALVESFDLDSYDVVISSSHCAVKSVIRPGRAVHICYCHSPMRYGWDQFNAYFGEDQVGRLPHAVLRRVLAHLARWDAATSARVDAYVANSQYVAGRIRRYYNRGSTVVYPPVDTEFYRLPEEPVRRGPLDTGGGGRPSSSFLVVSALVPYKKVDVAIAACRRVGAALKIVGRGPQLPRLQQAADARVEFLGWRSDEEIRTLYQQATAVLLPGIEDFGMVPVEAQACGCPVVALGKGGATETVVDGRTGVLVPEDSAEAFTRGLERVSELQPDPIAIRQHALRFSRDRFLTEFRNIVDRTMESTRHDARHVSKTRGSGPAAPHDSRKRDSLPSTPQDARRREYRPPARTRK